MIHHPDSHRYSILMPQQWWGHQIGPRGFFWMPRFGAECPVISAESSKDVQRMGEERRRDGRT